MEHIILFRNPRVGRIGVLSDEDGIKVFSTMDEAVEFARNYPYFIDYKLEPAWPFQIVELDEL